MKLLLKYYQRKLIRFLLFLTDKFYPLECREENLYNNKIISYSPDLFIRGEQIKQQIIRFVCDVLDQIIWYISGSGKYGKFNGSDWLGHEVISILISKHKEPAYSEYEIQKLLDWWSKKQDPVLSARKALGVYTNEDRWKKS